MYAEKIVKEGKMVNRGISLTCVLTPCRLMGVCVMLMTLGAIGAAIWVIVTYCTVEEDTGHYDGNFCSKHTGLFPVTTFKLLTTFTIHDIQYKSCIKYLQVNSADQHLRIFDSTQKRWRQVCSSSANELLARVSCEEVGFVSVVNYSITSVQDVGSDGGFFCVRTEELSFGKKIKDALFLCDCESKQVLTLLCQDCGRRSFAADRIVGGMEARQGMWPWQVSLQYNGVHQCGGSIISDRWIVSAAHCFPKRNGFISHWRVLMGSIYNKPANANVAEVKTIVYHGNYLPFVVNSIDDHSSDIAVLALAKPITFNEYIQPICLPAYGQRIRDGQIGTVIGWGSLGDSGDETDVLYEVNVPVISDAMCNAPDYYYNQITGSMFCAGFEKGGVDACQGDSGGPFMADDRLSKTSRYRLLGVVSWGIECATAKKPGVYTTVSRFLPWISTAMRNYNNSPGIHKMARA